jgi:hypothetical protein
LDADAYDAAHHMLNADPSLTHLCPLLSPASFVVDCMLRISVRQSALVIMIHNDQGCDFHIFPYTETTGENIKVWFMD